MIIKLLDIQLRIMHLRADALLRSYHLKSNPKWSHDESTHGRRKIVEFKTKFLPNTTAKLEDSVMLGIDKIPKDHKELILQHIVPSTKTIIAGNNILGINLLGEFFQDNAFDETTGVFSPNTGVAIIAERIADPGVIFPSEAISNTTRHELGHMLDNALENKFQAAGGESRGDALNAKYATSNIGMLSNALRSDWRFGGNAKEKVRLKHYFSSPMEGFAESYAYLLDPIVAAKEKPGFSSVFSSTIKAARKILEDNGLSVS